MDTNDPATAKALAVALTAVSKSLATLNPLYGVKLASSLISAEKAGLPDAELALLRLLVASATATPTGQSF